jgi:hypothetical protein
MTDLNDLDDIDLPFIDDHHVLVDAPAALVWRSLAAQLSRGPRLAGAGTYARLVAAEPRRASGTPLSEGATLPGFRVAESVPGERVRLVGRHRFSRYALTLTLVARPDGALLSARSRALFPGPGGYAYRLLVVDSGAHRVLVPRLLHAVRRRAERWSRDERPPADDQAR